MQETVKTIIKVRKRYKNFVLSYLNYHKMDHQLLESDNDGRSIIEIKNLQSREAFDLGVKTQAQLLEGEYLI